MTTFQQFSKAVTQRIQSLGSHKFFVTTTKEEIWETYINAFPEGTNPLFRERTEHDCNCCKQFITRIGNTVAINPTTGEPTSIWDIKGLPYPYDVVAEALHRKVGSNQITMPLYTTETRLGNYETKSLNEGNLEVWNHFYTKTPLSAVSDEPAKEIGNHQTNYNVFKRALEELTKDSLQTVTDLIDNSSLYRGAEFKRVVSQFTKLHEQYTDIPNDDFIWLNASSPAARIRNTVIGSLLVDLSEGRDIEAAVASYEEKVAPTNYRRTTTLVTPLMMKKAVESLEQAGLKESLYRRHANVSDVSINDILWVNDTTKSQMKDPLDMLVQSLNSKVVKTRTAVDITMEDFIAKVLPKAIKVDALVENQHLPKLVNITAPVHQDSGNLFNWNNNFAWSYVGNLTDSIKERVKQAGGNVSADVRISLAWHNTDDLDIHMHTPTGRHIYYGNRQGILDVDANGSGANTTTPVENLALTKPVDGVYVIKVVQYAKRNAANYGFTLQVESPSYKKEFTYDKPQRTNETISALILSIENGDVVSCIPHKEFKEGSSSTEKWGITTDTFVPVNMVMYSPNHWLGEQVGNKHTFLMLDGCSNPDEVRGFYNEYLSPSLSEHRKALDMIAGSIMCEPSEEQLAGIGFSSTIPANVTLRVTTKDRQTLYNVTI